MKLTVYYKAIDPYYSSHEQVFIGIKKKSEVFGPLAPTFLEGAEFALENQWISVEEDLPCNHKELLDAECQTKKVFILKCGGFTDVDYMLKIDGKWIWF